MCAQIWMEIELKNLWLLDIYLDTDLVRQAGILWHSSPFRLLGSWHQGALTVILAQPSSAPVERIFSMLKTVVSDQQNRGLVDYQTGSMMLYSNIRERGRPA